MITLDEKIFELVKDNNAFWVMMKSIVFRADNNQSCLLSLNTISDDTGLSKTTAIKALKYLFETGVIAKELRTSEATGNVANQYTITTNYIDVYREPSFNLIKL